MDYNDQILQYQVDHIWMQTGINKSMRLVSRITVMVAIVSMLIALFFGYLSVQVSNDTTQVINESANKVL